MNKQVLLSLVLLLGSGLVHAAPERRTDLDQAVSEARDRYPGRVISAETRRRDGREYHNIRILTGDGRVRRYQVDANDDRPYRPVRPRGRNHR